MTQWDKVELRKILGEQLSRDEGRNVAFDLNIPYDDLPAESHTGKMRELVGELERRGQLDKLVEWLKLNRREIDVDRAVLRPDDNDRDSAGVRPELYVSEFTLTPSTPTQGRPVAVRVGVYNQGTAPSGPFTVQWWAGENYPSPECTWQLDGLVAKGGRILTCNYAGYPSWYGRLTTKAVIVIGGSVGEQDEQNHIKKMEIKVGKA